MRRSAKSKFRFTLARVLAGLAALAAPAAFATVFTHLTGEDGVVEYDYLKDQGNGWYSEPTSAYRYKLGFKQGERDSPSPVLVATLKSTQEEHLVGKAAIELQIEAHEEKKSLKAAHKVDIGSVRPSDPFSPPVATPKDWYHGFGLKIDAAGYRLPTAPGEEVIFEQWWQGSPFHPPVALAILNEADSRSRGWQDANPDGNFALVLRDDDHNSWESAPGQPRYYNLGPVKTGSWIKWVVRVRPSPSGADGGVSIFMDGSEKLKLTSIPICYDRARYPAKPTPAKSLAVGCCIYRANGPSNQRFFFDEIKFADTFEEAATP